MNERSPVSIPILIIALIILAALVGGGAFWLGQQTAAESTNTGAVVLITPSRPTATTRPPRIITNTPTPTWTLTPTPSRTPSPTLTPTQTPTPTPTPIVVISRINALGRLETTEYVMQTVVDLENDRSNLWEQIVGSDKLMLIAEGEVVAGFDLEKIDPNDIDVENQTVRIVLPAPEILYSRIDNERTQVYERQTGLFVSPDPTLESRARQLAEEALVEWATERDIFEQAEQDGRVQIENFLRSLGFTDITIEFKEREL